MKRLWTAIRAGLNRGTQTTAVLLSAWASIAGTTVAYGNSPPTLSVSGAWVAVPGDTLRLKVTASEPDREDWVVAIEASYIGLSLGGPLRNRLQETNRLVGDAFRIYGADGVLSNSASAEFVVVVREEDFRLGGLFYPYRVLTLEFSTWGSGPSSASSITRETASVLFTPKRLAADFSASALWGEAPLTVNFASQVQVAEYTAPGGTTHVWDFGDGQSTALTASFSGGNRIPISNPSHTFQKGTYTVKLTVRTNFETSTVIKERLICAGCLPQLSLATDTLNFGEVPVDSSYTLPLGISNTGTAAADVKYATFLGRDWRRFSSDTKRPILFAGTDTTFPITFTPNQIGPAEAVIQYDFGFTIYEAVLQGQGVRWPPRIQVEADKLDFGLGSVGVPDTLWLEIANAGQEVLQVARVDVDTTHFALGPAAFAVEPGMRQKLQVIYLRRQAGSVQDTLKLHSNAPATPDIGVMITGETASPTLVAGTHEIHFDDVHFSELPAVGARVTRLLTVANPGRVPLHMRSISVGSPHFDVSPTSATVSARDSLRVEVGYTPLAIGTHSASLVIISDDLQQPVVRIPVYGAVRGSRGPRIEINPWAVTDTVILGTAQTLPLIIKNTGNDTLTITSLTTDSEVFHLSRQALVIAPDRSGFVNITFTPAGEGAITARLIVQSDALANPEMVVLLRGVGSLPGPGPVTMDFNRAPGDQEQREVGSAAPGKTYQVQLYVKDAPILNGWSATVKYPAGSVRYLSGSFQAGEFLPGLVPLVDEKEGRIALGGAVLTGNGSNSGNGLLGTFAVEVLGGFVERADLTVAEVNFRRLDGVQDKRPVRAVATITSVEIAPVLRGDFDGNGEVAFDDFFLFADHFGGTDPLYDLNGNSTVDFDDFFLFADHFADKK